MTVRITRSTDNERPVLKIAGRLQSVDISELDKVMYPADGSLMLDLSELLSADKLGIERLRGMVASGAELRGVSHYVQMLLDNGGPGCAAKH